LTDEAQEKLRKFFEGFASSAAALLMLDYDGTLAPFRVDRFKARSASCSISFKAGRRRGWW
jgi:trehalose 6-phosphate synthase/trehalose 6-phosphate phosphatase